MGSQRKYSPSIKLFRPFGPFTFLLISIIKENEKIQGPPPMTAGVFLVSLYFLSPALLILLRVRKNRNKVLVDRLTGCHMIWWCQ